MSQLVGRVPGFIFVPPNMVFFGTSLVLALTTRSAAKNQKNHVAMPLQSRAAPPIAPIYKRKLTNEIKPTKINQRKKH